MPVITRHRARQIAFQFLYQRDLRADSLDKHSGSELTKEIQTHFNHFDVADSLREFSALLIAGVLEHRSAIDARLESLSQNWKLARMPVVDRNILRLACYELLHTKETPTPVVIDEAIELAKEFGEKDSASFINGILDRHVKTLTEPS